MFSHVMVGTRDLEKAKSFYDKVLGTIGFEGDPIHNVGPSGHSRLFYRHNGGTFCVTEPINGEPASGCRRAVVAQPCLSPRGEAGA
jgi:catechol 2,3-dioxygenase-like lactoylglutathione lyase family enzyme